jgi:Lrp/AsnC family leucine-responsive transcriptional regulator
MFDDTDLQILQILQENARTSNAEIGRRIGMAPSAILERIRKLETRGVILGYEARLNPEALGLHLLAYVFVATQDGAIEESTGKVLAEIPEVQEIHHIAGEDCYLVKVRTANAKTLGRMLRERFGATSGVRTTRTTVVLEIVRERALLPLPEPSEVAAEVPAEVPHA